MGKNIGRDLLVQVQNFLLLLNLHISRNIMMANYKSVLFATLAVFLMLSLFTTEVDSKKKTPKVTCVTSGCTVMMGRCNSPWFHSGSTPCEKEFGQYVQLYRVRCCKYEKRV